MVIRLKINSGSRSIWLDNFHITNFWEIRSIDLSTDYSLTKILNVNDDFNSKFWTFDLNKSEYKDKKKINERTTLIGIPKLMSDKESKMLWNQDWKRVGW